MAWRARCAMIFQQFNLVGRLDVIANVLLGRLNHHGFATAMLKRFSPAERAFAIRALDRLDMAQTALQRADTLSGGQQQRVRSEEHTSELQSLMRISYDVFCLNKQKYRK